MGEKKVESEYDESQMRSFTRAVLNDLQAIEKMLANGMFEDDVHRIGAEQELFIVDSAMHPSPISIELIEEANDTRLTTEIGRFNLEANLTPLELKGACLSSMERELNEVITLARDSAAKFDSDIVLAGILPTIQPSDLTSENLTPIPRYHEINRVVTKLHGDNRVIHIKGRDEIQLTLQDTFIEFCNTSFQVHLQVGISELTNAYNWAQAIAAPVLASAVNSPLLFNRRLWHETRLALFQHATDTRSPIHQARCQPPRVNFGDKWIDDSVIEVLHEDAVRFRILLTQATEEDAMEVLATGGIPKLSAWRLHNGTIWRWNRICYGVVNGKPGLRIEARFLPSGPTVVDEMANAAFFLGLMIALPAEFGDIRKYMSFDDAKNNFFNVARYGLNTQIHGLDGQSRRAGRLILEELLPRARAGLKAVAIEQTDIDRFLGVLEDRVRAERTGAQWMIDSLASMDKRAKPNVRMRSLTSAIMINQQHGKPLHTWPNADIPAQSEWIDNYKTVEQFMATDLFTVRPEDVVDLAASLMHWRHVRHVPVEDDEGRLIGILTHRDLLELFALGKNNVGSELVARDVMRTKLITIKPETSTLEALRIMRENDIGCLPVVRDDRLVGLITAHDFLTVSAKLLEEKLIELAATAVEIKTLGDNSDEHSKYKAA